MNKSPQLYNPQTGSAALWIIGAISIVALILAWAAYNRSGVDLTEQIEQEVEQAANEIEMTTEAAITDAELAVERAEARAELLAIQAELEAEENYAEALNEVQEVRADLAETYSAASLEARQEFREIDAELEAAEQSVRNESGDALEVLGGAILLLEEDVRTDES